MSVYTFPRQINDNLIMQRCTRSGRYVLLIPSLAGEYQAIVDHFVAHQYEIENNPYGYSGIPPEIHIKQFSFIPIQLANLLNDLWILEKNNNQKISYTDICHFNLFQDVPRIFLIGNKEVYIFARVLRAKHSARNQLQLLYTHRIKLGD